MPRAKAPLDAEVKSARRQATLHRYAKRNEVKLRAAAQTRMQQLRLNPLTEAQAKGKRAAEKTYRTKHNKALRAADALRRAKKCIELHGADHYDALIQAPTMAKTQRKHEGRAPAPRPQRPEVPNHARREFILEPWSDPGSSDEEDSSPIPGSIFYGRDGLPLPRLRSQTPPELHCDCVLPAYCAKCTCGCDYACCLYHHENEDEHRRWMKDLTREEGMLRAQALRAAL